MQEEKEEPGQRMKITPNEFGGSVGYRVLNQMFIQEMQVVKIKTDDISTALEKIREENPKSSVNLKGNISGLGEDEYLVEIS